MKTQLKSATITSALVMFITLITNLSAFAQEQLTTRYLSRSLADTVIKDVKVITEGGNIVVLGTPVAKEATLEMYVKNPAVQMNDIELASDLKANYKLSINTTNGHLDVSVARISDNLPDNKRLEISFILHLPNIVNTDLTTSGGYIDLSDVIGTENLTTSKGKILIANCDGKITGATAGGDIIVHDLKQSVDLSTSGGKVIATNCSGDIQIATSGGNIIFKSLDGNINVGTSGAEIIGDGVKGKLVASTAGGNIVLHHIAADVSATANHGNLFAEFKSVETSINLTASKGDLRIVLPKDANLDIHLSGAKLSTHNLGNFNGGKTDNQLKGQLNSGGITLYGLSVGGNVDLTVM